ncbi:MAG TPA: GNAT family N-acetyltransferase [Candidatus Limnocylindria bacterium]|nr:GNAT family N-acetyltransferase [Candidatus Limnocylindria bacterium]
MPQTIRSIQPEELTDWFAAFGTAFYIWGQDPAALAAARHDTIEIDRVVGAFEDDVIVGTFRTFGTKLTLPGGARIPVNAVSGVSVRPTHRRRGTLSRMIQDDFARAVARGDAASILIASEWPIYGRFGYGPATWHARWTLRVRAARLQVQPYGSIEVVDALAARRVIVDLWRRIAEARPGEIDRPEHRWDFDFGILEYPGRPRWNGQILLHRDPAGELDGWARFHGEEAWEEGIPDNVLELDELHGVTFEAEVDLWRHLSQMDLTATIKAPTRREREPMTWFLSDGRAARMTGPADFLWLRLLDVERVLAERTYDRDGAIVIEVTDVVGGSPGPAAGRYRLEARNGAASCARTAEGPDVTVDARSLGAASLGGTRLIDATRTSGPVEHRAGALRELDRLLSAADEPWCTTWF